MNHTMARLRGAGSLLLSPGRLVDWLLDRLDELNVAMMPARFETIPLREIHDRRRFD